MKNASKFLFCLVLLFALFGCVNDTPDDLDNTIQDENITQEDSEQMKIYKLAIQSGYKGTYEEWLESIKGDSIVLQVSNGYIQWKYSQDTVWTNLISLTDLVGTKGDTGSQGPQGAPGENGKSCEFRVDSNYIQWRYEGESDYSWRNLLSFSVLKGENGQNGLNGQTPELRVNDGYIQWKYTNNSEWTNLIDLKTIGGIDGLTPEFSSNQTHILWKYTIESNEQWRELISKEELKGETGETGKDGQTSEFRVDSGYLQWKYTDESESAWRNIISLSDLRGEDGSNGAPGSAGQDGRTPEFREHNGYLQWKYTDETESAWRNIISLSDLRGEDGINGEPGSAGQDGRTPEFREYNGYLQWKYTEESESAWRNVIQLTYPVKYINVTFDLGDGRKEVHQVESATNITPLEVSKQGYRLLGWYYGDRKWEFDFYVSSKDITLTAKWEKGVTFTFETDTNEVIELYDCFAGYVFVFPNINETKENYKFIGWEATIDGETGIINVGMHVYINEYIVDQIDELVFTAVWEKSVNIVFDTGVDESIESIEGVADECIILPSVSTELPGLKFVYWKDSFGNIYSPNSEFYVTTEMIEAGNEFLLTAVWSDFINVIFEVDGEIISSSNLYVGDVVTLPSQNPSKENNVFLGWKIDVSNEILYDNSFVITEDIIEELDKLVVVPIWGEYELADGVYSFVDLSYEEKTEILGLLEKYAVENNLTGISLFENGGYVMYNDRIVLGTENYIPGFGFGTLAHGDITADMENETNTAWKRYYHIVDAFDPGTANYLNDNGSQVADYFGYFSASYYTTFMKATKDGYDWVPELAKAKPTAVLAEGEEADGMHTTWAFPIRVGSELKYNTLSTEPSRAAYKNREVVAEDYLTPFRILLTQGVGYFRGSELAYNNGYGAIKGAAAYYAATESIQDPASAEAIELFNENVGIKVYEQDGETWFQVEFTQETNQFYAMYYITNSLYSPVPMDFFQLVGKDAYLGYNADKSLTPVDNSLALGAYTLEYWETDNAVAYKKNPNYVFADEYYKIPGVKITILKAAAIDEYATFNEFLEGNIDSARIPQAYLADYKNDTRTRTTTGDSNFKLNINALDAETWEYYFGVNGVIDKAESENDYWQVEPALSNRNFIKALSYSIDRVQFADKRGSIASVDYLSSNYMSDPENGISYVTTDAHKNAIAELLDGTDGYGYSLELAREYFKLALEELVQQGAYTPGTKDNPTKIELEIAWIYPQHETDYHEEIEHYLETAFNHESVHGGAFELDVVFWVGAQWSDVYYKKMMLGQYDLGFGSVSGNFLNPLDFLGVLSADPNISGGFTLNWGSNTNKASDILCYNGKIWSFDALWKAANGTAVVKDGELVSVHAGTEYTSHVDNADGTITVEIQSNFNVGEGYYGEVTHVILYTYTDIMQDMYGTGSTYTSVDLTKYASIVLNEDGSYTITVTLTVEQVNLLKATHGVAYGSGYSGIDIYFNEIIADTVTQGYASIYAESFIALESAE